MTSFKGYLVHWHSRFGLQSSAFKTLAQARKFIKDAKKDGSIKSNSDVKVYFESAGTKENVTAWALSGIK